MIERMRTASSSTPGCAVSRRSFARRRTAIVDGRAHCSDCALLVAIAKAMLRAAAIVVAVALLAAPAAADMPNPALTPGAVADRDATIVCAYGYARAHRNVPYAERDAVYREYGILRGTRSSSPRRGYRIDHLVPLEFGGANDVRNLWPQRFAESEVKDRVESALHEAVCYLTTAPALGGHFKTARPGRGDRSLGDEPVVICC
jgi:hypothetical protein